MRLASYTVERTLPATPERVYRALTVPADLAAWAWGTYGNDVRAEADAVVGGAFEITTDAEGLGWGTRRAGMRGVYLDLRPGARVAHTLHWDAPVGYNEPGQDPLDEAYVFDLVPDGAGCRMRFSHLGIPDDGISAKEHERSMRLCFDVLARHLEAHPA